MYVSKIHLVQLRPIFYVPPISSAMAAQNPPLLGSVYSGYVPQADPNDPNKVIKKFGIFEFFEYVNRTPWHVPIPLNLTPTTSPLSKIKYHLPNFSGNGTCSVE